MTNEPGNKNKSKFRLLREDAGLTLAELGRQIGVSERNAWDWERGLSIPRLDRAIALAKVLKVPLVELCRVMGMEVEDLPNPQAEMVSSPLKELREAANLNQDQLSIRLGVSISTLRRWEVGDVEPEMTREQWEEFCRAVGVAFDELPKKLNLRSQSD